MNFTMTLYDQHKVDKMLKYIGRLRKKKIPDDKILFGLVSRFNPTREEYTEAMHAFPLSTSFKNAARFNYVKRMLANKDITRFNTSNVYQQQIKGEKVTYKEKGKRKFSAILRLVDNDNAGSSIEFHKKPRDGYEEKIKRLEILQRDKTVKKRAKKLLQEIEA